MLGFDYVCLYLVIPVCALCCAAVWWLFGIVLWVYSACYLISLRLPVLVYALRVFGYTWGCWFGFDLREFLVGRNIDLVGVIAGCVLVFVGL